MSCSQDSRCSGTGSASATLSVPTGVTSMSRPGGTAGWLWNFRLDDVGRWHDSELLSLGGQLDHNDLGLQLEEFTSSFQCKKTDSEAAGHHKATGPILRPCSAEQATTAGD